MFLYRREEDYSDLGLQTMRRAKEIIHELHLAGEFDPSLQDALHKAAKEIGARIAKRAEKLYGRTNGKPKNNGAD